MAITTPRRPSQTCPSSTDPVAGVTASHPATVTMTDAKAPAAPPPSSPPVVNPTAGLPVFGPGDAATPLTPARLPAPAAAPTGARGRDTTSAAAGAAPGEPRGGAPLQRFVRKLLWNELAVRNEHCFASATAARNKHCLASAVFAGPGVARGGDTATTGVGTTTPGGTRSDVTPLRAGIAPTAAATTTGPTSPPAHGLGDSAAQGETDGDPSSGELVAITVIL